MSWHGWPRVLRYRAVAVTAALFLAWGAFSMWAAWSGWRKLTEAGLATARGGSIHVAVTLDFAPEAFHMMLFQSIGRLIEVKGKTAYLMDVRMEDARRLASEYWVKELRPWPGR
ncbi:MAG TPA: hypothetical protein VN648_26160 [Candidatus Methylomirabilis sp.]|nr:hypothetical protein [Candidatus Methylomirabilis sp.]